MKIQTSFHVLGLKELKGHFVTRSGHLEFSPENARTWKTYAGAARYIAAELAAGSDWEYAIIPALPSAASALGKLGAGKLKTISPEESAARAARMASARAKRWE
jgi:hypothetical protein